MSVFLLYWLANQYTSPKQRLESKMSLLGTRFSLLRSSPDYQGSSCFKVTMIMSFLQIEQAGIILVHPDHIGELERFNYASQ
jgi:hypothetical protein